MQRAARRPRVDHVSSRALRCIEGNASLTQHFLDITRYSLAIELSIIEARSVRTCLARLRLFFVIFAALQHTYLCELYPRNP